MFRANDEKRTASAFDGVVGGLIATLPMSALMLWARRKMPPDDRYDLPPEEITEHAAEKAGVESASRGPALDAATLVSHFGFGASAGAGYAPFANNLPLPWLIAGPLYGFSVWFTSYKGWLPAAQLLPPAEDNPPAVNRMMILAHLVWGGVLGWIVDRRTR